MIWEEDENIGESEEKEKGGLGRDEGKEFGEKEAEKK